MATAKDQTTDGFLRTLRSAAFVCGGTVLQRCLGKHRWLVRSDIHDSYALTFDDGPDPHGTPRVAAALQERGIKATFFCVGERARQHPRVLMELVAAGHQIGSHTYSHRPLSQLTKSQAEAEIRQGREAIEDVIGQACNVFRPPHGKLPPRLFFSAGRLGGTVVLWTYSSRDYTDLPVETLKRRIDSRGIRAGDIILQHDTAPSAVQLVAKWATLAEAKGYRAVTIAEVGGK